MKYMPKYCFMGGLIFNWLLKMFWPGDEVMSSEKKYLYA